MAGIIDFEIRKIEIQRHPPSETMILHILPGQAVNDRIKRLPAHELLRLVHFTIILTADTDHAPHLPESSRLLHAHKTLRRHRPRLRLQQEMESTHLPILPRLIPLTKRDIPLRHELLKRTAAPGKELLHRREAGQGEKSPVSINQPLLIVHGNKTNPAGQPLHHIAYRLTRAVAHTYHPVSKTGRIPQARETFPRP